MPLAHITFLIRDYDEAIAWFTQKLGFVLVQDLRMSETKRWVLVAPPHNGKTGAGTNLLLARADKPTEVARIGDQTGGRVAFFLTTDNFARDHAAMTAAGVKFLEAPRHEPYGSVAVFEDLWGNKWDLIQPAN